MNLNHRLAIAVAAFLSSFVVAAANPTTPLGKAPEFALHDLEREVYRLADYSGRVLVVNFWASWCVPCRQEIPSMNRAARALRHADIDWLAVNVGEELAAVEAFRRDYPIDFKVLLDTDGKVSKDWSVIALPTTHVISVEGDLVHQLVGKREWDDAEHMQLLQRLLDENTASSHSVR